MEHTENNRQKIDLFTLIDDFLREVKRLAILGIVLMLVCSAGLAGYGRLE